MSISGSWKECVVAQNLLHSLLKSLHYFQFLLFYLPESLWYLLPFLRSLPSFYPFIACCLSVLLLPIKSCLLECFQSFLLVPPFCFPPVLPVHGNWLQEEPASQKQSSVNLRNEMMALPRPINNIHSLEMVIWKNLIHLCFILSGHPFLNVNCFLHNKKNLSFCKLVFIIYLLEMWDYLFPDHYSSTEYQKP